MYHKLKFSRRIKCIKHLTKLSGCLIAESSGIVLKLIFIINCTTNILLEDL